MQNRDLYLDLMKKCLLATIYDENRWYVLGSLDAKPASIKGWMKYAAVKLAWSKRILLVSTKPSGWGMFGYTMVGQARLDNIQLLTEDVIHNNIPGDLIETGCWRGGATIFMRAVLKANGITDRIVWVADSFEGLPSVKQSEAKYKDDSTVDIDAMNHGGPMQLGLAVPLRRVKDAFAKFDLLDEQVRFLKGWFKDTLPGAPIKQLSILRLDGDMYESTMDALNALYDKVSVGGYVIVDDYNCWPHCQQAVDEFRSTRGITDPIISIDVHAVYWKVG